MNKIVEKIQQEYQEKRKMSNYSIFDIQSILKDLAEKGLIWVIKDMKNICDAERFIIQQYLNEYRANQIYDNLDDSLLLPLSNKKSAEISILSSQKTIPVQKQLKKKQQNHLKVRNVKDYVGYKKAKELEEKIIEICRSFPPYEIDHIVDQITRSSSSIKERIEIGEQIYIGEKYNQYSIAIGSAKETSAWLQISLGQKYINQFQFDELDNLVNQVVSILTRTLCNLRSNEGSGLDLPSPYTPDVKKFGAYKNALLLVERIYEITRKPEFWKEKNLVKKMRKHATSCVANIAEAHQLYIPKKFRFFNDSLKALKGLDSLLETSLNRGILLEKDLKGINELRISIRNVLLTKMGNLSREKVG